MTFRQTLKKLSEPARNYKKQLIVLFLRGIFLSLLAPIFSLMIKDLINGLQSHDTNSFLKSITILGSLMFLNIVTTYFVRINNARFKIGIQNSLYQKYLSTYLLLENNFTEKIGTGKINNILQKGCDNWMSLVSNFPLEGFAYILRLFVILFIMAYYLGGFGFIVVLVVFSLSFAIAQYGNTKTGPIKKQLRDYYTSADSDIIKIIMSKGEINQSQKGSQTLERINNIFGKILGYEQSINFFRIFSFDIQRGAIQAMQVTFLLIIGYGVLQGKYELGLISMFWMLSNQINNSLEEINNYITNFHTQIIYVEKLRDTFDKAPMIQGYDSGQGFSYKSGNIIIQNISFSYNSSLVFHNFSLELKGGTKTAFVGESGGGKTTLIKLLAGYLRPDSGEIIIDGQKLSEVKLTDYYRHIGYLTQEPSVFDGTVWENLTYALDDEKMERGKEDKREKDIHRIITLAKCEFIYEFEHGLQTEIGERGVRLSGGQKQRLAIAKIMLKNPNIILLDEPTSALDSFNEELVTEALHNLFKGRTVIVVAHRLQTVKNADRILYIEGGQVIEDGTHTSLIKKNGNYKKMLDLQSGF